MLLVIMITQEVITLDKGNTMVKRFDKEYSTQYTPEMQYLKSVGIQYTFVKEINGVNTYKYTKSPNLFRALEKFYTNS